MGGLFEEVLTDVVDSDKARSETLKTLQSSLKEALLEVTEVRCYG